MKHETPRDATGARLCEHCQTTPVPESLGTKPRRYCSRNCRQRAYEARKTREAIVTAVAVAVAHDRRTSRDSGGTSRDAAQGLSRDVAKSVGAPVVPAPAAEPVLPVDQEGALFALPPLPTREQIEGELARRVSWIEGLSADGE